MKCSVAVQVVLYSDAGCDVKKYGCCISAGVLYSDAECDVDMCSCCIGAGVQYSDAACDVDMCGCWIGAGRGVRKIWEEGG